MPKDFGFVTDGQADDESAETEYETEAYEAIQLEIRQIVTDGGAVVTAQSKAALARHAIWVKQLVSIIQAQEGAI